MLGVVFGKARNRVQDPAKLERLIKEFVDRHEWLSLDADLKGDAYEGLIEKTAQEGARGAGQYFTPRALISAIVDVMQPGPDDRICDPACGTGGFFLGTYAVNPQALPPLGTAPDGSPAVGGVHRLGDRRPASPAVRHEPAATRHREPRVRLTGPRRRRAAGLAPSDPLRHGAHEPPVRTVQRRTATSGTTSGPPPATSNSTSSSTW